MHRERPDRQGSLLGDSTPKTFLQRQNYRDRKQRGACQGLQWGEGPQGTFWGDGAVPYLDCAGGYPKVNVWQTLQICTPKRVNFMA